MYEISDRLIVDSQQQGNFTIRQSGSITQIYNFLLSERERINDFFKLFFCIFVHILIWIVIKEFDMERNFFGWQ